MPWVSRRDLDRLYALVDKLADHKVRTERKELGMPEVPAVPRKPVPPMPPDVANWLDSHEDGPIRDRLKGELTAAAQKAGTWEPVQQRIQREGRG